MSVDDWFSAGRPAGKIAITVDDGYRCTLRNLVSALAAENIPSTVFLCGRALQGGLLWRDKVRALITTDTIVPFLEWVEQRNVPLLLGKSDFYRVSKSPTVHSPTLETAINEYVEEKAGWLRDLFDALVAEFADTAELIDDPNISYGNHTFNHYVMASLSAAEQEREIVDNELFLNGLGVRRSRVFALPFGRSADYNETTVQMCKQAGLRGFLLSDHRVNFTRSRAASIPWSLHLARRSLEGLGDGRSWAPEQRREEFGEVDKPLPCGADHAGEDLLGLRAPGCPIAATDFTVDAGGANGVFGTPVGGLHLGRPQEGEHGSELAVEMGGEALGGRQGGRRVEESSEAREQAPAGHGEAVLGDRVRLPSITECEGVGEDRLHAGCPRTARMIRGQGARSAHQVRQTRLMQRRREAAIRRPPVSHQDAVKVGAQHLGRLVEAAPVAHAIHRSLRRGKRPQPVPHRADPPAGLVGAHDGTAADLCAQRGVGRGGHAGRAMQHLHEPPGRHRQPEALPQECGHLGEWHADLLVQARNQCDGARPQVDVGGPHRVRGLQRMATLHAAPALCALPDGHMKAPDDRPDDGEIFLVLRRHALQCHHPAAPRTRRRERGLVGRINPGGNRAARPAPIPAAGSSARLPAVALGPILGERRGLPEPRPPRGCKLPLQALVLPLQSIVLTLQALVLTSHLIPLASQLIPLPLRSRCHLPQPRDLLAVLPDLRVPIGSGTRALIGHAILMTDSCE